MTYSILTLSCVRCAWFTSCYFKGVNAKSSYGSFLPPFSKQKVRHIAKVCNFPFSIHQNHQKDKYHTNRRVFIYSVFLHDAEMEELLKQPLKTLLTKLCTCQEKSSWKKRHFNYKLILDVTLSEQAIQDKNWERTTLQN